MKMDYWNKLNRPTKITLVVAAIIGAVVWYRVEEKAARREEACRRLPSEIIAGIRRHDGAASATAQERGCTDPDLFYFSLDGIDG
jgi:hypothetical protein